MGAAVRPRPLLLIAATASLRLAGALSLLVILTVPNVVLPSVLLIVSVEPRPKSSVAFVQAVVAMTEWAVASLSTVKLNEPGVALLVAVATTVASVLVALAVLQVAALVSASAALPIVAKAVLIARYAAASFLVAVSCLVRSVWGCASICISWVIIVL